MLNEKANTIRTTLYLTQANKNWLENQPRGLRTKIINTAIQQFQDEQARHNSQKKLLSTLDNLPLYATDGIDTKAMLVALDGHAPKSIAAPSLLLPVVQAMAVLPCMRHRYRLAGGASLAQLSHSKQRCCL